MLSLQYVYGEVLCSVFGECVNKTGCFSKMYVIRHGRGVSVQECPTSALIEQYESLLVSNGQDIEQVFQELVNGALILSRRLLHMHCS